MKPKPKIWTRDEWNKAHPVAEDAPGSSTETPDDSEPVPTPETQPEGKPEALATTLSFKLDRNLGQVWAYGPVDPVTLSLSQLSTLMTQLVQQLRPKTSRRIILP